MAIQDTDSFLVNRNSINYRQAASNIMAIQDSDLVLINRGGTNYKATGLEVKEFIGVDPANPSRSDFTAVPPFDGGIGTLSNPYIITPAKCYPGGKASSRQVITVSNQQPDKYLVFSDLNKATNGVRFNQDAKAIGIDGKATFVLIFEDYPATTGGGSYTGLIKCGSAYFKWVVTVETTSYNDLPLTGDGGGFYSPVPSNDIGAGTWNKSFSWDTSTNNLSYVGFTQWGNISAVYSGQFAVKTNGRVYRSWSSAPSSTNVWQLTTFSGATTPTGVVRAQIASYLASGSPLFSGASLIMTQKADGSTQLWTSPIGDVDTWSFTNNGPTATVKKFYTFYLNYNRFTALVALGSNGNVYSIGTQPTTTSPFYEYFRPGLGSNPTTVGTTWGLQLSGPINGEAIVDAQVYYNDFTQPSTIRLELLLLTSGGKVYTTEGTTSNSSPAFVCDNALGISTFYLQSTAGINKVASGYGVLKRDGTIWARNLTPFTGGVFASSSFSFRQLISDQSFLTPPLGTTFESAGWYALDSSGYAYGAAGNSEAVRFGSQPSPIFNVRQQTDFVVFEGIS